MRQNEERSARADKNKKRKKTINHDKKPQHQPSPSDNDPVPLGERLRRWAQEYNWYQTGRFQNALVISRTFAKPIGKAVDDFLSQGCVALAIQIKTDFDLLIELVKRFDNRFHQKFGEEEEWIACEYLREKIHTTLDGLAARLDNRDLKTDCPDTPPPAQSSPKSTAAHDKWLTFAKAAELLAIGKGTVSKWAKQNRFVDNGLKGQRRRLSKLSVLMVKQEIEDKDIQNDVKDLRLDARRQAGPLNIR